MTSQSPKILILYASYGDGHYQASKAVEASLRSRGVSDITLLDLMAEAHPLINGLTKFVYMQSFKTIPGLYGWVYNATKQMPQEAPLLEVINSLGMNKLQRTLQQAQPNLIIHTFPQLAMPRLLKRTGQSLPMANIITDFDLHGRWIHSGVDRYYVATEDLKAEMVSRGIPEERIRVSGIPVKPEFHLQHPDRQEHLPGPLQELFLKNDTNNKTTILLMAGAYGAMQGVREVIERFMALERYRVIAVCGRNRELYRALHEQLPPHSDVHLLEYVDQVAALMHQCDCIVTKPGGITLSEALACRLPVFVYRPVPGQELNNARYLAQKGVACITRTPAELTEEIDALFQDPHRLTELRQKIENLRRPEAAEVIADDILEQWFAPKQAELVLS
ncbi:MGDG synthase family glycosyltransferase [Paenibacillus barengoltzii]|uniref:Processive 1,2-diacylglycerol beta-glucosyltransferase n=1 Tax=Paenibacillus barengoltzii J12 TaxID=935846 RepID=A0ABY1M335_9BACL|nr:glycosyltransferase [Paenibacillus barengoltzii]SMF52378.1 processive 1,2-diacylglycerol beta-glucosyltransferase [Paenibacillus barengoltzii J12]